MARAVRLDALRTYARLYADQRTADETTAFVTKTDLNSLINLAIGELYDVLVEAAGSLYYSTDTTIATIAGTSSYALPAKFYRLLDAHIVWAADDLEPLHPLYNLSEQYKFASAVWGPWDSKAYRLKSDNIILVPTPTSVTTIAVKYIPSFTDLSLDADTFDGVDGWEKVVALRAAVELLAIQNKSNPKVTELYDRELDRVKTMASDRDAEHPHQVVDVYPEGPRANWFESNRRVKVL